MLHQRTAIVSAAALLLGVGLFGVSALPASGDPTASNDQTSAAGWDKARAVSVAAAERRMDAEAGEDGETLFFFAVETDAADVDLPPAGFSPGDFFLFEEDLYGDQALTQRVGADSARGELSLSTVTFEATFRVPGGKIRIAGSLFSQNDIALPITGGTGQFLDARGLFIPFGLPNGTTVLIFRVIS